MGKNSKIPWTNHTWNPWIGCNKVSPGCDNCYAERWAKRCGQNFGLVRRASDATFNLPLKIKEPSKIFVCSLSDFFHPAADQWRIDALKIMARCEHHTFIVVTKRPERAVDCIYETGLIFEGEAWEHGLWFLATVENQEQADKRILKLLRLRDYGNWPVLGVSIEPMLGPIIMPCAERKPIPQGFSWVKKHDIDWVIVGAESGAGRRACSLDWVRRIRDDCREADVPLFIKQLEIDGKLVKDVDRFPVDLRIQNVPVITGGNRE